MQIKTGVKKMWVKIASINPFMTEAPITKIPVRWFAEHSSPKEKKIIRYILNAKSTKAGIGYGNC